MKLKDWRIQNDMSQQDFANHLEGYSGKYISQRTISAWEDGALPRKAWIKQIIGYTKNQVTAADLAQ